jgi:hypothetical protein
MKFQIPSSKFQRSSNPQAPNTRAALEHFEFWNLKFFWCLEFGAWNL